MPKILLILTGGTICCQKNDGILSTSIQAAELMLVANFQSSDSPWREAEFVSRFPLDTLSENMTVEYWQLLLDELRQTDFSAWDGVIIAHGTDTLGFSAALLDAALDRVSTPVVMVSSNFPIAESRANGNHNFRVAVELICQKRLPGGVWAVYRNGDGRTWLHRGRDLRQCQVGSDEFFSFTAIDAEHITEPLPDSDRPLSEVAAAKLPLHRARALTHSVLMLQPYVGLDYRRFDLQGLRAVVHGVYHSGTVCTGKKLPGEPYATSSLLYLLERCKDAGIPLFVGPGSYGPEHDPYSSMVEYIRAGAIPVASATPETIYARALLGCAMFDNEQQLIDFVTEK